MGYGRNCSIVVSSKLFVNVKIRTVQYLVFLLENASYVIFFSPQWSLGQLDGYESNGSYFHILYVRFQQFQCIFHWSWYD